jgi:hypothetical protein
MHRWLGAELLQGCEATYGSWQTEISTCERGERVHQHIACALVFDARAYGKERLCVTEASFFLDSSLLENQNKNRKCPFVHNPS